ncbi:hypothetical protein LRC484719_48250 [Mycobacterium riyadhense]
MKNHALQECAVFRRGGVLIQRNAAGPGLRPEGTHRSNNYVARCGVLNRGVITEGYPDPDMGMPRLGWRTPGMSGFRSDPTVTFPLPHVACPEIAGRRRVNLPSLPTSAGCCFAAMTARLAVDDQLGVMAVGDAGPGGDMVSAHPQLLRADRPSAKRRGTARHPSNCVVSE